MKGFGPFLFGAVVGGVSVFASLSYHFLYTKDGLETVPKLSPTFAETYVDVRPFTVADWQSRKSLSAAVLHANKGSIIGNTAIDQTMQMLDGRLNQLGGALGTGQTP